MRSINNRTQMIRTAGPGHLEERTMSSACNPYLALSAYVMAGLDGIRRKLDPGEPYLGNLYALGLEEIRRRGIRLLPQTLAQSLAEVVVSYGDNNRTQMIRTAGPGHLEERTMSSACNPYLALSAYVMAGLDGIRRKLDPGEPYLGNLFALGLGEIRRRGIRLLPQTLAQSLDELKQDELVQESLGAIYDEFMLSKEAEWREYHRQVTRWEIERYLTFF